MPGSTGLKIIDEAARQGMKITEQALDPKIAEAAFKLWGWTPARSDKNNNKKS